MTGSQVRWVDPSEPGSTKKKKTIPIQHLKQNLNLLLIETETEAGQETELRFIASDKCKRLTYKNKQLNIYSNQ
jgi:hypothetical protein